MSLGERKSRILQAIVQDYVQTTKPVGSERLIELHTLGCKSATVRNEMAELTEQGYIVQPHTSAGRIPTDQGYRYYVDSLMPPVSLESEEEQSIHNLRRNALNEIDAILLNTCRILSSLTSCLSVASDPITETTRLHHVLITQAVARNVLLVVLFSTGQVEHRLVELTTMPNETMLIHLTNFLNSVAANQELSEVARRLTILETPNELQPFADTLGRIIGVLNLVVANSLEQRRLYLEGSQQILRQPEFHDVTRLKMLFHALEQKNQFYKMLQQVWKDDTVAVIIGRENNYESLHECSVITAIYHIGDRPAGFLGVVGPTRINYEKATVAVEFMANHLSQSLTYLSQM